MVDYSAALPQLTQFQAPNMLAMAQQASQMQAANTLMQQRAQELQKENALRAAGAKFGVNTPEYAAAAGGIDPEAGLKAYHYQAQIVNQQRQALGEARRAKLAEIQSDKETMDLINTHGDNFQKALRVVDSYPEDQRAGVYSKLYEALPPKLKDLYNPTYSPEAVNRAMMTTADIVSALKPKEPQYLMGPADPIAIDKNTGTFNVVPETGAAPAAPVNAYAARTAQIEGTGKNPNSSAQGKFQFIDSTFVDTAKKAFPELANRSPSEILALRGTKLSDGTQIEDALEQRFRADNIAALTGAGIQPTAGNTYLAHFLGAGGATKLLSADPHQPVSQLLDPRAIAANESILKDKTAGQVAAWANGKYSGAAAGPPSMTMGQQFRPEGSAPGGLNALVPMATAPAAPANMLAAPQQTPLSLNPSIAGPAPAPTTLAGQRAQIAKENLEAKGAEQTQKLEIDKRFSEAERAEARQEFDKTLANIVTQYKDLGAKGMLVKPGETSLVNRAKAAAATYAPGLTTIVSPERG